MKRSGLEAERAHAPGKRSRLLLGTMTAGFTFGACLLLLIGFFALRAYREPHVRADVVATGDWMLEGDAEIGYVAPRNSNTTLRHKVTGVTFHVHTDARRARIETGEPPTPPHVEILAVGCSFTWGHGVEAREAYPARLGRLLGVRVANVALAGYSGLNALQVLSRNLDLKPKVVLYGFIEAHLDRNLSPCAPSYPPYCLPVSHVILDGRASPHVERPDLERYSPETYRRYYSEVLLQARRFTLSDVFWRMRADLFAFQLRKDMSYPKDLASQRTAMRLVLDGMASASRRVGARLVVAYIPYLRGWETAPPPQALREASEGLDLTLVDLEQSVRSFAADSAHPALHLPQDGHPSAAAHQLLAKELSGVLAPLVSGQATSAALGHSPKP